MNKFISTGLPVLIIALFSSCSGLLPGGNTVVFIIPRGDHYSSGLFFESISSDRLDFCFEFDQSAVYNLGEDNANQADINKLFGFAEGSPLNIHQNSARFGWRWYNNELQILAYSYTGGTRKSILIGTADIGFVYSGSIRSTETAYIFNWNGNLPAGAADSVFTINKDVPYINSVKYLSYPYFGGDQTAPHEIRIKIRIES